MSAWLAAILIAAAFLGGMFTRQQIDEAKIVWREHKAVERFAARLQADIARMDRDAP
jgi:hypothetical protein